MRKLLVACECGQQMQVPRSAIGRMGMCPTCGLTIRISSSNTSPVRKRRRPAVYPSQPFTSKGPGPPEGAKQRFGQAVDLYYGGKYGEALAIFDSLAKQFPGNPDIERGRAQCIEGTRRPALPAPQNRHLLTQSELNEETVRRVILDKLLNGRSEAIQLQAAELAAKVLGMLDAGNLPKEAAEEEGEQTSEAATSGIEGDDEETAAEESGEQDDGVEEVPAETIVDSEDVSAEALGDDAEVEAHETEADDAPDAAVDEDTVLPAEERFRAAQ